MDEDRPTVGIIGLGDVGREHAALVEEQAATLVGDVDVDEAARDQFRDRFDVPVYVSVDAVLDAADSWSSRRRTGSTRSPRRVRSTRM